MTSRPDTVGREKPRVVIVGGGFGGLEAARALAKADAEVVLFDRHNHHLFQPLL
ncbi:MAG: FAD-dependent oxidoreductase, partial [Gemmatimonadota bacterium]